MEAPPERQVASEPEVNAAAAEDQRQLPGPVIVGCYRDLSIASVAKSILDSAGIESMLADEGVIQMDWFYSNAIGGIKLGTGCGCCGGPRLAGEPGSGNV